MDWGNEQKIVRLLKIGQAMAGVRSHLQFFQKLGFDHPYFRLILYLGPA
jgi:hypothetical protein